MNLSRTALSIGIATLLIGAVLPTEANAQRIVRLRQNQSSNNSAKDPLGVDFELTDAGLVEDFSYAIDDGTGGLITLIKNASGSLVKADFSSVSDILSYEFSLLDVDVDASSNPSVDDFSTDLSIQFSFEDVSDFFPGLSSTPSAQDILDFLFAGNSSMSGSQTSLNASLSTDNSNIVFLPEDSSDLQSLADLGVDDLNDDGEDPLNDDIVITVLEEENAQVPEPGVILGLVTLGTFGFGALRKKGTQLV